MKKFIIVLLSGILTLSVTAQTITITFNGANKTKNYQVVLDGTSYYSNSVIDPNSTNTTVRKQITLSDQQLGPHTIAVYRLRNNTGTYSNGTNVTPYGKAIYTNRFRLREGYDMDIIVNGNGRVMFSEKSIIEENDDDEDENFSPMTDAAFDQLVESVRIKYLQSSKVTVIRNAFLNKSNHFTTEQVGQLISVITTEANKLTLAKLAYPRVTDPSNFTQLYEVFNNEASKNEMNIFIRNNPNNNNSGNSSNNNLKTPMANYPFSQLLQTVNNQYSQASKFSTITGAFNNSANYFTTAQVKQLISLISSENDRLTLAKQSYLRVSDPSNFNTIYDLFYNQAYRNDLNNYVIQNGGSSNVQNNIRTPMADYQFNQLLQTVNNHYNQSNKYSAITGAFNNSANYFTTGQVKQLLSLITSETERLTLAKQSYLRVSDPTNFGTLYDLFYNQAYRNDLNNYVIQNGGQGSNVQINTKTPMGDVAFNQLYQKARNHIRPSSTISDLRDAFNNSSNYFSTAQIRMLLSLVSSSIISSETDILEVAKLSWHRVTDPVNFPQIFDLFRSQANRDALNAYIQARPY